MKQSHPVLKHIFLLSLVLCTVTSEMKAQTSGNDEKYRLPYKNTCLKEPLVTENECRIASETILLANKHIKKSKK